MILYFDPFMGIAGDMAVAALVDAGADPGAVNAALGSLGLGPLAFSFEKVNRRGIRATLAKASLPGESPPRSLGEILEIFERGRLCPTVRERASAAFRLLAAAEAKVHGCPVGEVHFHEVGAADSIADIVGAFAAWDSLGSPPVESGPLNLGSGFAVMDHGTFPVPPPAVVEILKGVPVFAFGAPMERTTPTGAALVATMARRFGPLPRGRLAGAGYGAGTSDPPGAPNVFRVLRLEEGIGEGLVSVVETQVDDMTPEYLAPALETLRQHGALDVSVASVQAKKGRPAWHLTVLCAVGEEEKFASLLFENTSTLGVRLLRQERLEIPRESRVLETPHGPLRVKVATLPSGRTRVHPEWEDVEAMARRLDIPPLDLMASLYPLLYPGRPL